MLCCRYDLLVNGGGSVDLVFQRRPFVTQRHNVMVASNSFVVVDTVTLLTPADELQQQQQQQQQERGAGARCARHDDDDTALVVMSPTHLLSTLTTSCHTLPTVTLESQVRHSL